VLWYIDIMKNQNQNQTNAIDYQQIRNVVLDCYNNPKRHIENLNIKEYEDITKDIIQVIKALRYYGIQLRYTNPESKKQSVFIDRDNRIKLLGMKGNTLKSDTIMHFSRVKYILHHSQHLSKKAIQRILTDRNKIKTIDIDHKNNNKLDNTLKNLQAIPHKININHHFDILKTLPLHQAKQYAKKYECEHMLIFI